MSVQPQGPYPYPSAAPPPESHRRSPYDRPPSVPGRASGTPPPHPDGADRANGLPSPATNGAGPQHAPPPPHHYTAYELPRGYGPPPGYMYGAPPPPPPGGYHHHPADHRYDAHAQHHGYPAPFPLHHAGYMPYPPPGPLLSGAPPQQQHPGANGSPNLGPPPGMVPPPGHVVHTDDATEKVSDRVRRRCFNCCTTETSTWRRSNLNPGKVLCNKCGLFERTHSRPRPEQFPHKRGPLGSNLNSRSPSVAPYPTSYAPPPPQPQMASMPHPSYPPPMATTTTVPIPLIPAERYSEKPPGQEIQKEKPLPVGEPAKEEKKRESAGDASDKIDQAKP